MKSPNQTIQPTAGRCIFLASLYENTSIASHARSRQRWLILFSLGLSLLRNRGLAAKDMLRMPKHQPSPRLRLGKRG